MKKILITLILISYSNLSFSQEDALERFKKSELIEEGKKLPKIELPSLNDDLINLGKFEGKYIFINFWATWCKPCIENMPNFEKLIKKHKTDNIEFVYISVDKSKESWKKFVKKKELNGINLFANGMKDEPISYFLNRIIYDNNGGIKAVLSGIPVYVLIDPNGTIIENDLQQSTKEEINQLLDKVLK
jgi:peroxiredoxin|tara:strand:- start:36 stop:599 length:564 start_codon:yes stop_codon:yes gene_type:complete